MPNLLLLQSDEHCAAVSSIYGHPRVHTPNMERLARMGTVYDAAYCPSPLCLPSRSAYMAGRHVHQIQCYSNCNQGLADFPSYGRQLAQSGVHSVHVGKTDVYRPGAELGFSEMLLPRDRAVPGDTNHGRTPLSIRQGAAARANGFGPREDAGAGDLQVVDRALEWLREEAASLSDPWVLSVQVTNPHFPHYTSPELWAEYADAGDLADHGADVASARHPYACDLRAHFETEQFTEEQVRGLRRGYLGCVTFVDRQLGRLLDELEATGQLNGTVVAYTSDHGDMLGRFGMWWKCSLYEPSVRVPLVVAGPGFESGSRSTTPVSLLDLQATTFAATDAQRPSGWRGQPLQGLRPDDDQRVAFAEYHGHGTRSGAYMVRRGTWKLIYCMEAPHLLFDLEADPDELDNRYDARPDVAASLEAELRRICDPEAENTRAHQFEREQLAAIDASG